MWNWKFLGRELEIKAGLGRDRRSRREGGKKKERKGMKESSMHSFVHNTVGRASCAGYTDAGWQDALNVWMKRSRWVLGVEILPAGH